MAELFGKGAGERVEPVEPVENIFQQFPLENMSSEMTLVVNFTAMMKRKVEIVPPPALPLPLPQPVLEKNEKADEAIALVEDMMEDMAKEYMKRLDAVVHQVKTLKKFLNDFRKDFRKGKTRSAKRQRRR